MATVPYQPFPTAQPTSPGENISVNTPGPAFGENIGAALKQLGSTTEHVGDEIFQRATALQELRNETEAREADAAYAQKQSLMHADYSALEGKAARDGLQGYIKQSNDLRQQIRSSLSSPNAQKMYDASSLGFMQRNVFNAAGHAASENKKYVVGTALSKLDTDAKTFVDPKNEAEYDAKLESIKQNAPTVADAQGWGTEQTDKFVQQRVSHLRMAQAVQVAREDPQAALRIIDEHKDDFTQDDYNKAIDVARSQNRAIGGAILANKVYDPDKSFKEMEDEVRDQAKPLAHNDPMFEDDAVKALRAKYLHDRFSTRQDENENMNSILKDGIMKGVTNQRELLLLPGMQAAFDALPPKQQAKIPGMINSYNESRDKSDHDHNFTQIKGLYENDKAEFLNLDPMAQNLSQSQIRQVLSWREKALKDPSQDPRVQQAMTWLKGARAAELQTLGVVSRDKNNPDDYDHFTGALQTALELWREEHGKPASYQDLVDKIGPQIINQQATHKGMLWNSQEPAFHQWSRPNMTDVPHEFSNKLTQDVVAKGGQPPTEYQVYQAYIRTQFIKLYGASSGGPATAKPQ